MMIFLHTSRQASNWARWPRGESRYSKCSGCWLVASSGLWMKLDQVVQRLCRLKLQAGSSENNANVPDLVEVWQPPQCIPGAVWSMEGSISCATLALFWWNGRPATKLSLVWFPHNSYLPLPLKGKVLQSPKVAKVVMSREGFWLWLLPQVGL